MKARVQFSEPMALVNRASHMSADEVLDLVYQLARDLIDARQVAEGRRIEGYCPMGCGRTLTLGHSGVIECVNPACEDHVAVTALLTDASESEHIVRLYAEADFTAKHPIKERVADSLFECTIGAAMLTRIARDLEPGTYRVSRSPIGPGGWQYEPVVEAKG